MMAKQRPDGLYDLTIGEHSFTGLTWEEVLEHIKDNYYEEENNNG